jgi:hypothetical protein
VLQPASGFGSKVMFKAPLKPDCWTLQGNSGSQTVVKAPNVQAFPAPFGRRIEILPRPEKSPICMPLLATPTSFASISANGALPPRVLL